MATSSSNILNTKALGLAVSDKTSESDIFEENIASSLTYLCNAIDYLNTCQNHQRTIPVKFYQIWQSGLAKEGIF